MQLKNRISKVARNNVTGDPTTLAQKFLDEMPRSELVAMLAEMIEDEQRVQVRQVERTAFSQFFTKAGSISSTRVQRASEPEMARLRKVFDMPIALGTKLRRKWGDLTVAEHQKRIELLSQQRDGLNTTISQHQVAIRLIEQAGVKRLRDISELADKEAA
jgi:hypothetical protein